MVGFVMALSCTAFPVMDAENLWPQILPVNDHQSRRGPQCRLVAPSVWTGRALQAGFDDQEITGLAHLYSAH
jgi:hypothetical protein